MKRPLNSSPPSSQQLLQACRSQSKKDLLKALMLAQDAKGMMDAYDLCVKNGFEWGAKRVLQSPWMNWSSKPGECVMDNVLKRWLQQGQDDFSDVLKSFRTLPTGEQKKMFRLVALSIKSITHRRLPPPGEEGLFRPEGLLSTQEMTYNNITYRVLTHPLWEEHQLNRAHPLFFDAITPLTTLSSFKEALWQKIKPTLQPQEVIEGMRHFYTSTQYPNGSVKVFQINQQRLKRWEEVWQENKPQWWWQEFQRLWNDIGELDQRRMWDQMPSLGPALEKAHLLRKVDLSSPSPVSKSRKL